MSDIEAIALLQDPIRRRLYDHVVAQDHEVSRNEAAEAAGVQRTLAAFHLDKLVEAGLLDAVFRRLGGRTGPGAGRPAKLYRPSAAEHEVSLPPRDYRTAATLLAEAAEGLRLDAALEDAARRHGQTAGQAASGGGVVSGGGAASAGEVVSGDEAASIAALLAERGYTPVAGDGEIRLRNCPFHALAEDFPPLVCGMNLALLGGLLDGLGAAATAHMDARPGWCCVTVRLSKTNED